MGKVREYLKTLELSNESLELLIKRLHQNFDLGLTPDGTAGKECGTIKMLPTYVRDIPQGTKTEEGDYFALDLGGTNFRVLHVQIKDGSISSTHDTFAIKDELMKGVGDDLFDFVAEKLAEFAVRKLSCEKITITALAFTFSFPVDQKSLYSGSLIKWTKGFCASGVEGEDVVELLKKAISKRDDLDVQRIVLVNDTTGVMMRGAFDDKNVQIGLILGTGTNACYMENLKEVKKWTEDDSGLKQVIINTEWGAFGDKGDLACVQTKHDVMIDEKSINKGSQIFEKMISGMYLGCLAQQIIIDLIKQSLLFGGELTPEMEKYNNFETRYVSDICSDEARACVEILSKYGYENPSLTDCTVLREICDAVSCRAAKLAATGLASIIRRIKKDPVTVAVDGSLFKKHPTFQKYMEETLKELVPQYTVKLVLAEDGSGLGAALCAAVAKRLEEE